MNSVAMSGADTVMINNRILTDLADGDCVKLDFPNDIMSVKTGKNGNSIYGVNEMGKQVDVEIRLLRGSSDDKFLNGLLSQQSLSPETFVLLIGEFIKRIGDGTGATANDTYIMSGGVFVKLLPASDNVEGGTDQSVVMYRMKFSNSPRVIT